MPINFHPRVGQLLTCDFSKGFKPPEMVKASRPVLVLSTSVSQELVTVIPLSTVLPSPVEKYHYQIPMASMPQIHQYQDKQSWVKGDMLYTVGWHRLARISLGGRDSNGKRIYFTNKLSKQQMSSIYTCVFIGLGITPDIIRGIGHKLD